MLTAERLLLRRFRPEDAPVFAAYRSHPDVARYQSWEPPFPLALAEAFVQEMAGLDPVEPGWFQYAVEAEGALIGDERGLHKVSAECDARNDASAKLLARLGFRREGHLVEHTWIKGEWTDDLLFGLLAREWRH